jgi:uncharacterized membrane protein
MPGRLSFLRPPSLWYWILSALPLLSYSATAVIVYYNWTGGTYYPIPYFIVGHRSGPYLFGPSAVIVVISLFFVAWSTFRFLRKSTHILRKTQLEKLSVYGASGIGFISCALYAAMALFQVQGTAGMKWGLHIATLASVTLFSTTVTAVLAHGKRITPTWLVWAYDIMVLVLEIIYGILAFSLSKITDALTLFCALGYVTIALAFARFPLLGKHLLGPAFIVPFATSKKR